ncbi:hypothetical protein QZH41_019521, partial [Actinostola sp. cb2023]
SPKWRVVFDFEQHGKDKWTLTGTAFSNQPTYGDNPTARHRKQPSHHMGKWWIGGFENRPSASAKAGAIQGDKPTGTMTSPPFVINGNKLRFLIGGGCNVKKERVELVVNDGMVVAKATGKCTETMATQEWNVGDYVGKTARVRLVDSDEGGFGHINFDQLEMWTKEPIVRPAVEWRVVFDFEQHGKDKWTLTGTAFNNQPTYGDNPTARHRKQPSHNKGKWWIGGFENRPSPSAKAGAIQGDKPTGTMTSPLFLINGYKLSFLIGGGCDLKLERVELLIDGEIEQGKVVAQATGKCTETMATQEWNVGDYVGKFARVRLVDSGEGGFGHINFDQLELWTEASIVRPAEEWRVVFDFEQNGKDKWTLTGTAFNNQPTYGDNPTARHRKQPSHNMGKWWIGGFENRPSASAKAGAIQGDKPTGTMTSPPFVINGNKLRFLIGGGCNVKKERVELVI